MSRPSTLPAWVGTISTPSASEQTAGWAFRQKPPHQIINWFWNLVSLWLTYLDAKVNGSGTVNLRPMFPPNVTLGANYTGLHGWVQQAGAWRTPAGSNTYIETNSLASHGLTLELNITELFNRIIGPGDAIQIDSVTVRNQRLGVTDTYNVVITGSSSGAVFSETGGTGVSGGIVDDVVTESSGAPKIDTSETWTLQLTSIFATAANDIQIHDIDIAYTITTA